MYVYICIYVCMYVCMYVLYVCICMYVGPLPFSAGGSSQAILCKWPAWPATSLASQLVANQLVST